MGLKLSLDLEVETTSSFNDDQANHLLDLPLGIRLIERWEKGKSNEGNWHDLLLRLKRTRHSDVGGWNVALLGGSAVFHEPPLGVTERITANLLKSGAKLCIFPSWEI